VRDMEDVVKRIAAVIAEGIGEDQSSEDIARAVLREIERDHLVTVAIPVIDVADIHKHIKERE